MGQGRVHRTAGLLLALGCFGRASANPGLCAPYTTEKFELDHDGKYISGDGEWCCKDLQHSTKFCPSWEAACVMDLYGLNIKGPPNMSDLSCAGNIEVVNLINNRVVLPPRYFNDNPKLRIVWLNYNSIDKLEADVFEKFNLQEGSTPTYHLEDVSITNNDVALGMKYDGCGDATPSTRDTARNAKSCKEFLDQLRAGATIAPTEAPSSATWIVPLCIIIALIVGAAGYALLKLYNERKKEMDAKKQRNEEAMMGRLFSTFS